ncbi:F-box/FBD/LRR-repeat protein At1g16930 isoform X2 [Hevea brasiliensis]|uniref:F-box/FBD/LRR-repeat protein At1g16930 isoform X2 n=1 Tax=Hevea brasiliensis TaxID=3981 RepID=UPI0025D42A96|nr:F-box/FBD/LRR-repeat protein At1g16930 isoform X2 [Hevea brasiliensis]
MGSSDVSKEKARRSRDRLSNLPDPLLHQIFSCLDTKQAIQSCVLSKRWRDFWVSLPHLNFDYRSFHTKSDFQNFVCKVLYSRLDNPIFGGKFGFHCGHCWKMDETLIKKVISCVESHWFQHLHMEYEEENDNMNVINMFRGLHKAQYVKLHYHTIEVLTLVPGLLEKQPSPFTNLKSLKLYLPYNTKSSKVPSHVMRYLLGDSSGADLIIVKS